MASLVSNPLWESIMAEDRKAQKLRDRVQRYVGQINSKEPGAVNHALGRLEQLDMTVDCLQQTHVGRVLNQLKSDPELGSRVNDLVQKWRTMASECTKVWQKQSPSENSAHSSPASNNSSTVVDKDESSTVVKKSKKHKRTPTAPPMDSFESQLMEADRLLLENPRKKKKAAGDQVSRRPDSIRGSAPDAEDIIRSVAEDNSSVALFRTPQSLIPSHQRVAAMSETMFDPTCFKKTSKTKVYAGRRKALTTGSQELPSLVQLCQRFIAEHLDMLEEVGDTPFYLLAPILDKCTPDQLLKVTSKNPSLYDDVDYLWERHTDKQFPKDASSKSDDESWYECYLRLSSEREEKLQLISARISKRTEQAAAPVRRTIMSDAITPSFARKRQIRCGIASDGPVATDALQVSRSRREIFNSGSRESFKALPGVRTIKGTSMPTSSSIRRNGFGGGETNGRSGPSKPAAPKTGHLMAKTLKMLKNYRR